MVDSSTVISAICWNSLFVYLSIFGGKKTLIRRWVFSVCLRPFYAFSDTNGLNSLTINLCVYSPALTGLLLSVFPSLFPSHILCEGFLIKSPAFKRRYTVLPLSVLPSIFPSHNLCEAFLFKNLRICFRPFFRQLSVSRAKMADAYLYKFRRQPFWSHNLTCMVPAKKIVLFNFVSGVISLFCSGNSPALRKRVHWFTSVRSSVTLSVTHFT